MLAKNEKNLQMMSIRKLYNSKLLEAPMEKHTHLSSSIISDDFVRKKEGLT